LAPAAQRAALGPADVAVADGRLFVLAGLGIPAGVRDQGLGAAGTLAGRLLQYGLFQTPNPKVVLDFAAFEAANDPHPGTLESNPFRMVRSGGGWVATDSASNSLLRITSSGQASVLYTFPDQETDAPPFLPPGKMPVEAVPTGLAVGADGAFYVSELTGFPFVPGLSRVRRIDQNGQASIVAQGFTNVIDLAFDAQGRLLVLEHAMHGLLSGDRTGALRRVEHDGAITLLASAGLDSPTGLAVGPAGGIYVANCGTCGAGAGSIVRVSAP
jgi:hypothetical protein